MKTILFLDHARAVGGAEKSLLNILERLDRSQWQIILGTRPGAFQEAAMQLRVEVVAFDFPRMRRSVFALKDLILQGRKIARFVEDHAVDVLYANTVRSAIYGSLVARSVQTKFIWHMREFWLSEKPPRIPGPDHIVKKWIGAPARLILANSYALAERLPYQEKVQVVYNGIDPTRFTLLAGANAVGPRFGIPEGSRIIGTIGRLRPIKGMDRFLRVAAAIARLRSDVYFFIVGGSPFKVKDQYARSLPALARDLGISDRVVFTGQLDDIRPALAEMDIFVNPGDPEPFGLVNIEAMALQKPVVAFLHGAMPEIVLNGETGILVPSGDEAGLTRAILQMLDEPETGEKMGNAGRRRVEMQFSADKMVKAISEILERDL